MKYQGHIENGLVILYQPLPLPDGTPVSVDPIQTSTGSFWQSPTLDELARQQGVMPLKEFDDFVGGWPGDEIHDQFEEAFLGWREAERE